MKSKKYKQLNNKAWLYNKYVTEQLTYKQIGALLKVKSLKTIADHITYHNIPTRNHNYIEGKNKQNFIFDLSIIEGSLLGDGYMQIWNRDSKISNPIFCKANKYFDHIHLIAKGLIKENYEHHITHTFKKLNDALTSCFYFRTYSQQQLKSVYEKWYKIKKVIPNDINITSKHLLHWYLDDGNVYIASHNRTDLLFCTECFEYDNQQMICKKIYDNFNIEFSVFSIGNSQYRMRLKQKYIDDFYNIVGPCPIKCFEYKWI